MIPRQTEQSPNIQPAEVCISATKSLSSGDRKSPASPDHKLMKPELRTVKPWVGGTAVPGLVLNGLPSSELSLARLLVKRTVSPGANSTMLCGPEALPLRTLST